jgi:hypothetical protein
MEDTYKAHRTICDDVRIALTIQADERAAFSLFIEREIAKGNVISCGEKVTRKATTFFITLPNTLSVWNLRGAWETLKSENLVNQ